VIAPTAGRASQRVDADPVVLVEWPADDSDRPRIAAGGRAALLLVAPSEPPPQDLDLLEDWLRAPIDRLELDARATELRLRHRLRRHGAHVDDHGVLHRGGRQVALTDGQRALVAPLLANIGRPVAREVVGAASARSLSRLRARLAQVGLDLSLLSGRAVLLQPRDQDSSHGAHRIGNIHETSTHDPDARPTRLT
jgi:hypothetical protein